MYYCNYNWRRSSGCFVFIFLFTPGLVSRGYFSNTGSKRTLRQRSAVTTRLTGHQAKTLEPSWNQHEERRPSTSMLKMTMIHADLMEMERFHFIFVIFKNPLSGQRRNQQAFLDGVTCSAIVAGRWTFLLPSRIQGHRSGESQNNAG